jgi:hypothetical protein
MVPINHRAFILLMGLGVCVMANGCFSCTEERTVQPPGGRGSTWACHGCGNAAAWFINDNDHDFPIAGIEYVQLNHRNLTCRATQHITGEAP